MLEFDPASDGFAAQKAAGFILYVEGARDRDVLRGWSDGFLPPRARRLFDRSVILGGRQPARAVEHFRRAGGGAAGLCGLCVLDRDDAPTGAPRSADPALEFFTWGRRHIESYLLVPDAIRRAVGLPPTDTRVESVLRGELADNGGDSSLATFDAKRLLAPNGVLPRTLGQPVPLGRIARAMRTDELHDDVAALFGCVRRALGMPATPFAKIPRSRGTGR